MESLNGNLKKKQMKVQVVKCSNKNLWYSKKEFPIKTEVINGIEKYDNSGCDSLDYNNFFCNNNVDDFYYSKELNGYIAKVDCINDEEYSTTLEGSKQSFNYELKARPWEPEFKPLGNSSIVKDKYVGEGLDAIRQFSSGAKRDSNANKPFVHNLKAYTRIRFGYHMTKNATRYGDKNWELGMPTDQYLESVDRHLAQYLSGDRSEDHLSAILFGIQGCMINEEKEGVKPDNYFNK